VPIETSADSASFARETLSWRRRASPGFHLRKWLARQRYALARSAIIPNVARETETLQFPAFREVRRLTTTLTYSQM
jgi:hypothetical protein